MIKSFKGQGTEDVYHGKNTAAAAARRSCPRELWKIAGRKLDQLYRAKSLDDLRIPPGNRLESLSGDPEGEHSIRINKQYRVCFRWTDEEAEAVEIVDYHEQAAEKLFPISSRGEISVSGRDGRKQQDAQKARQQGPRE